MACEVPCDLGEPALQCVAVLCGLPAAGKTTLCQGVVASSAARGVAAVHHCFDAVLWGGAPAASGAGFSAEAWKVHMQRTATVNALQQRRAARACAASQASRETYVRQLSDMLQSPCKRQRLVLVDDTNHYRCARVGCQGRAYPSVPLQAHQRTLEAGACVRRITAWRACMGLLTSKCT
jgi:tRNA uridine 5-carbamoylmethylation protein Kti12